MPWSGSRGKRPAPAVASRFMDVSLHGARWWNNSFTDTKTAKNLAEEIFHPYLPGNLGEVAAGQA